MNTKRFLRAVIAILSLALAVDARAQCTGDIVEDGKVDGGDLGVLLANWGPRTSSAWSIASDLNNDGQIDGADLGILLANWGACPLVPWANIIEVQPDPAVVTDPTLRAAIVATGLPWRVRDRGTGIEMLLIPPGTFQMGCTSGSTRFACNGPGSGGDLPVHLVTLTVAFYLGRYEVTQAQWVARLGTNPSWFQAASAEVSIEQVQNRPVERISWDTAQAFLVAANLRLPTEAEWEFACRAGTSSAFNNGSSEDVSVGEVAWFYDNSGGQTRPVGQRLPNRLGFHDMHGNVLEWVQDWWGEYSPEPQINPQGPIVGTGRVLRGGYWNDDTNTLRSSTRNSMEHSFASFNTGFRVARNP